MKLKQLFLIILTSFTLSHFPLSYTWASGSESGGGSSAADEKRDENRSEKREEMRRKMREKRNQKCIEVCTEGESCCASKPASEEKS